MGTIRLNVRLPQTLLWTALTLTACSDVQHKPEWEVIAASGQPTARHEASFVAHDGKLVLLGGRRLNPTDIFDPKTDSWSSAAKPPLEIHHFQAVTLGDAIYVVGAMTGGYPNEQPLEHVLAYYPASDRWQQLHQIPEDRRRGGAGAVVYDGKIYLLGGITNGHVDGYRPWFDEYDPSSGQWRALPDAPSARDHFQIAVIQEKLFAFAGRTSSQGTGQVLDLTVEHGDVFDFATQTWSPVSSALAIPTQRAGNMVTAWGDHLIVGGGESATQEVAHSEVEVYNAKTQDWQVWPALQRGRHGTGFALIDDYLYTASGAGNRGGGPELIDIERLYLPAAEQVAQPSPKNNSQAIAVHQQWHTITLAFTGPNTSETANPNPFTDYRLLVELEHPEAQITIRGFYAADGRAADSGAEAGNLWQARFTPPLIGQWRYRAQLQSGDDIALSTDVRVGEAITITPDEGVFQVVRSDKAGRDFRSQGRLRSIDGHFRLSGSGQAWLKGGANSPENFLAYSGFDGTYRIESQQREGESKTEQALHHFDTHRQDWRSGDPLWRRESAQARGHGIIGAVNYLASMGMNVVYFLTMNIDGDGKDVWPYRDPTDFTRFDVSKLDQWERLFQHMQSQGIALHMVTQETENELLLDGGNTGQQRQLYYQELIARFGHHLALIWNLGEENGPAHWIPEGQNHQQRVAMADFFESHDPYGSPVQIHTHSSDAEQELILTPLIPVDSLDGLSMQIADPTRVFERISHWGSKARAAGQSWLLTMDEVGPWQTGAAPDSINPNHNDMRRHVLWGALLAGAAGVEWYVGAHNPSNDLTTETWRDHHELWRQTDNALSFFTRWTEFWRLQAAPEIVSSPDVYAAAIPGDSYVVYLPAGQPGQLTLDSQTQTQTLSIDWYDPVTGGLLQAGEKTEVASSGPINLGGPPQPHNQDWVALLRHKP